MTLGMTRERFLCALKDYYKNLDPRGWQAYTCGKSSSTEMQNLLFGVEVQHAALCPSCGCRPWFTQTLAVGNANYLIEARDSDIYIQQERQELGLDRFKKIVDGFDLFTTFGCHGAHRADFPKCRIRGSNKHHIYLRPALFLSDFRALNADKPTDDLIAIVDGTIDTIRKHSYDTGPDLLNDWQADHLPRYEMETLCQAIKEPAEAKTKPSKRL